MGSFRLIVCAVLLLSQLAASQQARQSKPSADGKLPLPGAVVDGVYKNSWFGFTYKIPAGWVERTEQMRDDSTDPSKARVLLAIFERPPEVSSAGVNAAVIVVAESAASYPGLKTTYDYFDPLNEIVTSKGFKVVNEPYDSPIGSRKLVREDFRKEGSAYQSSLVEMARGFVVSFTFIGASESDVEELIEPLGFAAAGATKSAPSK
jgi:hypothetical protein